MNKRKQTNDEEKDESELKKIKLEDEFKDSKYYKTILDLQRDFYSENLQIVLQATQQIRKLLCISNKRKKEKLIF